MLVRGRNIACIISGRVDLDVAAGTSNGDEGETGVDNGASRMISVGGGDVEAVPFEELLGIGLDG